MRSGPFFEGGSSVKEIARKLGLGSPTEAPPNPHATWHLDDVTEKLGELEAAIDAAFWVDGPSIVDCVVAADEMPCLLTRKTPASCQAAVRDSSTAEVKFTLAVSGR